MQKTHRKPKQEARNSHNTKTTINSKDSGNYRLSERLRLSPPGPSTYDPLQSSCVLHRFAICLKTNLEFVSVLQELLPCGSIHGVCQFGSSQSHAKTELDVKRFTEEKHGDRQRWEEGVGKQSLQTARLVWRSDEERARREDWIEGAWDCRSKDVSAMRPDLGKPKARTAPQRSPSKGQRCPGSGTGWEQLLQNTASGWMLL